MIALLVPPADSGRHDGRARKRVEKARRPAAMSAARQLTKIVRPDTKIIPGHLGPVVGFNEIEQQLTMSAASANRIAAAIKAGKSEAEVIASKPTKGFDEGRMGGAITPDRFVSPL